MRPFLLLMGIFSALSFAEQNSPSPFALDNTEVINFHAKVIDKDYDVYVRLPESYQQNPAKKYPLVMLVDGYYAFPLLCAINWRMSERHDDYQQSIVVGISYSKGDDINASRTRDFTPTHSTHEPFNSDKAQSGSGGAGRYADFLAKEVLPYVLNHYRVDNTKKVFAGHSYGGLLATYILLTQPSLFDYYLIGSPSYWYNNKVMFKMEADYASKNKNLPANVFIATGAEEQGAPHYMSENMFGFERALRSHHYAGLNLKVKALPGEGHLSGYPAFITQGLLWALPEPKP